MINYLLNFQFNKLIITFQLNNLIGIIQEILKYRFIRTSRTIGPIEAFKKQTMYAVENSGYLAPLGHGRSPVKTVFPRSQQHSVISGGTQKVCCRYP